MKSQRGGFVLGLVAGLLIGLALALGVALYITKAPVPFVNKVPQRTVEQDTAETERNKNWDPNAPLGGRDLPRPAPPVAAASGSIDPNDPLRAILGLPAPPATAASAAAPRDPAAILAGDVSTDPGAEPFVFFVQVGAFTRNDDSEQQRAKLAMLGYSARITEREQAGRTVYRVRVGPYETREEADRVQSRLQADRMEARLVRVER